MGALLFYSFRRVYQLMHNTVFSSEAEMLWLLSVAASPRRVRLLDGLIRHHVGSEASSAHANYTCRE